MEKTAATKLQRFTNSPVAVKTCAPSCVPHEEQASLFSTRLREGETLEAEVKDLRAQLCAAHEEQASLSSTPHYNSVVCGPRATNVGSEQSLPWAQDRRPKLTHVVRRSVG